HWPVGPFEPAGSVAEIRRLGFSHRVVVGCGKSRQDRNATMTDICKVTRRHTLALGAGALVSTIARTARAEEGPERHGIPPFADLKHPPALHPSDHTIP